MKVAAIVPAAGAGKRFKSKIPKVYKNVSGKPLLVWTLEGLQHSHQFEEFVVVVAKGHVRRVRRMLQGLRLKNLKIVPGGASRSESVRNGLAAVSADCLWVLVHDAARPLISRKLVERLLGEVKKTGAVICGLPLNATVKRMNVRSDTIKNTENRDMLYLAQTPQVFRKKLILERYKELGRKAFKLTDEAALFDGTTVKVKMVIGDVKNIKVTTPEDLELVKFLFLREKRLIKGKGA